MERFNQPPRTEGCSVEGQEPGLTPAGRTTIEKRTPGKARAASRTRLLLKRCSLERTRRKRGRCQQAGTLHSRDRQGEGAGGLPGSQSVARAEDNARNRGGPEDSCRTHCEGQAGKDQQRRGVGPEGAPGVGSAHSIQWQSASSEAGEGADVLAKFTQATCAVRETEPHRPTFLWAKRACQHEEPGAANRARRDL